MAKKLREKKTVFDSKNEVINLLEKTFAEVTAKPIIDKKLNILHEYYSFEKKIAYTEYLFDTKDPEKIKFKHKLILVV
jgi:hypothetical protein